MKRGEIWTVDLEPTKGSEQRGKRPVLVISQSGFNERFPALVCPISSGAETARAAGFTVPLTGLGLKTDGAVLCHQVRAIDLKSRRGKRIEMTPPSLVDSVFCVIADICEG